VLTQFDLANEILADTLELPELPGGARRAFAVKACAGNEGLRRDVLRLLDLYEASGGLFDEPPVRRSGVAPGDIVAGRYRVKAELGRGGMGSVYLVEDDAGGEFALKTICPEMQEDSGAIARFHEEFRVARGIAHPNVCPVFEVLERDGLLAFTMAYLRGETLAERIATGPVAVGEARAIARGIAAGIEALHAAGIVHRDLKPSNIVLTAEGPVIMDFGLACAVGTGAPASQQTGRAAVEGSADYMAPEQFRGLTAGPAADVYAFGLILFEMVTGRRPFPAEDLIPAAVRRSVEDAPLVSDFGGPGEWDAAVAGALRRDARARPGLAGEIANGLSPHHFIGPPLRFDA